MPDESANSGFSYLLTTTENLEAVKSLQKYYRLLNPKEATNVDYAFNYIDTGGKQSPIRKVFDAYLGNKTMTGNKIIDDLQIKEGEETPEGYGLLYNTVTQPAKQTQAKYLHDDYWCPSFNGQSVPKDSKPRYNRKPPTDFYKEVCAGVNEQGPPAAFTINVLRGPILSEARKNANEVEMFLNHMPPVFASQMIPYFDVEFQFPVSVPPLDGTTFGNSKQYRLQRPSLYRYLMGSEIQLLGEPKNKIINGVEQQSPRYAYLTAADLNLSYPIKNKVRPTGYTEDFSYFSGMEMFTSPQTLTNMDKLKEGQGRLNEVKPFLPPASLIGAQIQMMNAGAGTFLHKKAEVTIKVHDKARLVEFSEFLRSAEGYRGLTVWLTYGWLAPRGRGDDDVYAKFINESMLVREAFMIKNNSFSFDASGQVEVKLELVSKGYSTIESATIDVADQKRGIFRQLGDILDRIKKNRRAFGAPPDGTAGSDVRIYQILDSATAGNMDLNIPSAELSTIIQSATEVIKTKKNISKQDRQNALELLRDVGTLYAKVRPEEGKAEVSEISQRAKEKLKDYNAKRFEACRQMGQYLDLNPDPFLPDPFKTVKSEGGKVFSEELIKAMNDRAGRTAAEFQSEFKKDKKPSQQDFSREGQGAPEVIDVTRQLVSFGKIFCVFCLPSLLESAKLEGIEEIQVNFFQFNEACGPMSLHNIAEFPVNINDFEQQFSEFVYRRGGEAMTVQEFMKFFSDTQFTDNRSPGYGMRSYYEPFDVNKPEETKSDDEASFSSRMSRWIAKWGGFKKPNVAIKMETIDARSGGKVDLLYRLQDTVGVGFNDSFVDQSKSSVTGAGAQENSNSSGKIKRISIYDKQFSPYSRVAQVIRSEDNLFKVYNGPPANEVVEKISKENKPLTPREIETNFFKRTGDVNEPTRIASSKNVLKEFVKDSVPTLTMGTNGSLIYNVNLASKADGILGTVNMQGSAFKSKATLAPNGLSMGEYSLPLRVVPANLTMNSLGCPLADLYQNYYIDLGTGTTIDNLYACTQLSHNFSPGKFETQWTFVYTDAYGKFFGAPNLEEMLRDFQEQGGTNEQQSATSAAPATSNASGGPSTTNR